MANWCSNSLEVKGKRKFIIDMMVRLRSPESPFTCENIISREGMDSKDILTWSSIWGSKWEPSDVIVSDLKPFSQAVDFITDGEWLEGIDKIVYNYTTAWSPVDRVVEKLSEMYPDLYFIHEFEEEGNGSHGLEEYLGGVIIRELELPTSSINQDTGEYEDVEKLDAILNCWDGYLDYAQDFLKERGFKKHIHKHEV